MNLKAKTINGFKWSFINNIGKFGGQFVIGIILTRLLSPTDFGLVGMLAIFIVIGQSLTNSGFGQALIQKKNADRVDFSTVFYFNIFTSIAIYLVFVLGAPLIAKFYNEPQLIILTKVICLSFVINSFGLIHIIHFEKELEFKAPSVIGIVSVTASGIISIFLALKGFGVWALVANTVLRSIFTTLLLWKISKWTPLVRFSMNSLRSLFSYGSKILIAGLIQSFFQNIYYVIIGRYFPTQSLGYYTRASQFKDAPINLIKSSIQKVTYPVFSSIQDENAKLTSSYTKIIRVLAAAVLPLMAFIFIISKPLIQIVLGTKWLPVVPYLQLMSLYAWIYIFYTINNQMIITKGRSDYYLQIQVIDKIFIVVSILLTYRFGITAMIYGHMVATVLSYLLGCFYLKKVVNEITLKFQLKNIFPFFISATIIIGSSFPLYKIFTGNLQYLISSITLGIFVYIFSLWILKTEELKKGIKQITELAGIFSFKFNNENS